MMHALDRMRLDHEERKRLVREQLAVLDEIYDATEPGMPPPAEDMHKRWLARLDALPKRAIVPLVLGLLSAAPASADVVYQYRQGAYTASRDFLLNGEIVVTDALATHGWSLSSFGGFFGGGQRLIRPYGFKSLHFDVDAGGTLFTIEASQGRNDFVPSPVGTGEWLNGIPGWWVDLSGSTTGISGVFRFFAAFDTLQLPGLTADDVGTYSSDDTSTGCTAAPCTFGGVFDVTTREPIAEPASWILLALWLGGLGILTAGRRRA